MSDSKSDDLYDPDSSSEVEPPSKKKLKPTSSKRSITLAIQCQTCGTSFKYKAAFDKHVTNGCKRSTKVSRRKTKASTESLSILRPSIEVETACMNPKDEVSIDDDSPKRKKSMKYKNLGPEGKSLRVLRRRYRQVKEKLLNNPITKFALNFHMETPSTTLEALAGVEKLFHSRKSFWTDDFNFGSWLRSQGLLTEYLQQTTIRVGFLNDADVSEEVRLQPFEAKVLDSAHADALINAAGPIWTCCFDPAQRSAGENRFFTVGLSRIGWPTEEASDSRTLCGEFGIGSDFRHTIEEVSSFPNVLQIWEAPSALLSGNGEALPPQIVYGIAFDSSGPIWHCVWCPHRFSPSAAVLGIVAILGGDGCVRVIALPLPPRNYEQTRFAMQMVSGEDRLSKVPLVKEDKVRLRQLSWARVGDRITAVSWGAHDPLQLLCGHADGTITLCKLNFTSSDGMVSLMLNYWLRSNINLEKIETDEVSTRLHDNNLDRSCPAMAAVPTV